MIMAQGNTCTSINVQTIITVATLFRVPVKIISLNIEQNYLNLFNNNWGVGGGGVILLSSYNVALSL